MDNHDIYICKTQGHTEGDNLKPGGDSYHIEVHSYLTNRAKLLGVIFDKNDAIMFAKMKSEEFGGLDIKGPS